MNNDTPYSDPNQDENVLYEKICQWITGDPLLKCMVMIFIFGKNPAFGFSFLFLYLLCKGPELIAQYWIAIRKIWKDIRKIMER